MSRSDFEEGEKLALKGLFDLLKLRLRVVEQRFGVLLSESTPELQELFEKLNLLDSAITQGNISSVNLRGMPAFAATITILLKIT